MTVPPPSTRPRIGVDLGGTNVRAGRVRGGEIEAHAARRIDAAGSVEDVMAFLHAVIDEVWTDDVCALGAGVPSVVDPRTGTVYDVQNIPSWVEVPLKNLLEARYDVPARVGNDANCFALGEYHYGPPRDAAMFAGLILGTGFAGGLVSGGRLVAGAHSGAGEFGMLPYRDAIFEHYCSGQFFEIHHGTTAAEMFTRAEAGDAHALALWNAFGTHLGHALCAVLYTADPDVIVFGGSVRHAYRFFEASMLEALSHFAYRRSLDGLRIEVSALDDVALLGAAALTLDEVPPISVPG